MAKDSERDAAAGTPTETDDTTIGVIGAGEGARDAVKEVAKRRRRGRKQAGGQNEDAQAGESRGAGATIAGGLSAMRDVRAASREHADARAYLKELEANLAEDKDELARRDDVYANYERIMAEERAEQQDANQVIRENTERKAALEDERRSLKDRLAREKSDNEQALRPYKELSDTSRGRSEDATRALAEAKRATKNAETQLNEATTLREQNIASANRALDNSQSRLRRVDEELRKLSDDPSASREALLRLQRERTAELAHVNASRDDVQKVTQDSQANVDRAQEKLFSLKNAQEAAASEASRAKADYDVRRREYEDMLGKARDREQALQDELDRNAEDAEDADALIEDARERLQESQDIVEDANDIHDNPEATEALRASVNVQRRDVKEQRVLVESLAATEKRLRKTTRGSRAAFMAVIVAAIVVVLAIALWLVLT